MFRQLSDQRFGVSLELHHLSNEIPKLLDPRLVQGDAV